MAEAPNVCLTLSNQPENVLLVREALSGVAETVGVDGVDLNDIRTAVTEACNNVVLHAYEGAEGPLQVELYLMAEAVEVVVRDHGTGIRPHIRSEEEAALGIGLSIIQALAPRVEFKDVPGGGTEVRMEFATPSTAAVRSLGDEGFQPPAVSAAELATTTGLSVAPSALARKVLPRVMCVLAARARFTTDRISDTELLADVLVADGFESSAREHLTVVVDVGTRELQLRMGPLGSGSAGRLIASSEGEVGPVIEKLTDERHVRSEGAFEMLELRILDPR
ncbi:MAG TPA: ATP-binding protein [Solirubrobacteraceae bacterium]|jgi:anti-sigma regulatory factor (Ser/Thr protein kinase)|nr:ATP-binding protein [Solirubrobacteraceae bacterium]